MTDVVGGAPAQTTPITAVPVTPAAPAQATPTPTPAVATPSAEGAPLGSTPSGAEGHMAGGDPQPASAQPAASPDAVIGGQADPTPPAVEAAPVIAGDEAPAPAEGEVVTPEVKAGEEAPASLQTTPTEPLKYEPWTLPENVSLAEDQTSALNNIFTKGNISPELGQEIVTYGAGLIQKAQEALVQQQHDVFAKSRAAQRQEFEKQAGNKRETIVNDAKAGLAAAVPNAKARAALLDVLGATGAGDNTHIIHAFANIGRQARERSAPGPSLSTPKPKSAAERRYGPSK